jgi:transcriptional regulator with XRE-family HTH domain
MADMNARSELDRLEVRFPNDPAAVRRAAGRDQWDHLARAVRRAREAEGISQSELARRAGISASVISRVESGLVRTPDERTTQRVATALGRSGHVLGHIVSGTTEWAADELDIPVLREAKAELQAELASGKEFVDDAAIEWKWEPAVMDALVEHFVDAKGIDEFPTGDMESDTRWALEQFANRWPGLTDSRKELVLGFLEDQLTLSRLDKQPKRRTIRFGAAPRKPRATDDKKSGS